MAKCHLTRCLEFCSPPFLPLSNKSSTSLQTSFILLEAVLSYFYPATGSRISLFYRIIFLDSSWSTHTPQTLPCKTILLQLEVLPNPPKITLKKGIQTSPPPPLPPKNGSYISFHGAKLSPSPSSPSSRPFFKALLLSSPLLWELDGEGEKTVLPGGIVVLYQIGTI